MYEGIVFFYWLFGTFMFALLAAAHEHGASLIRFAVMMLIGIVAGVVHALVLATKERKRRALRQHHSDIV